MTVTDQSIYFSKILKNDVKIVNEKYYDYYNLNLKLWLVTTLLCILYLSNNTSKI